MHLFKRQAVVPLGLAVGLTNGVLALELSGPSGQRFAWQRSMDGGPWAPTVTNRTRVAPVFLPVSLSVDSELWQTQSLP